MLKATVYLLLALFSIGAFAEKAAVITRAQGEALLQKSHAQTYGQTVSRGTILENNDKVKVNEGFVAMLLLDDQSQFKLHENTEVRLTLVEDLAGATYHIRLDYGQTLTDYTPAIGSGFQIHTPTSVVSVKGTKFWTISDPEVGDNVIVLEGEVDVTNNLTGATSTATAGQTIRSSVDGVIQSVPTEEGSIPEDPDDSSGGVGPEQKPAPAPGILSKEPEPGKSNFGMIAFLVVVIGFILMLY